MATTTPLGKVFETWKGIDPDRTDQQIMSLIGATPAQYAALQDEVLTPGTMVQIGGSIRPGPYPSKDALAVLCEHHGVSAEGLNRIIRSL